MLSTQDLQAIGHVIDEKTAKPLQELKQEISSLRDEMDIKFDAVQERFDEIENKMITVHNLERWETGLIGRLDQRYVRQ